MASSRRAKGRVLLEALERPGSSQLHDSELLKLAEANVPVPPAHDQGILSTPPGKIMSQSHLFTYYPRQWISVVFVI